MAFSKKDKFSNKEIRLAAWSKALALDLPLSQSTVGQHLKALREAGLIQEGIKSKYCIKDIYIGIRRL